MKGLEFHDGFKPKGCKKVIEGSTITAAAGTQMLEFTLQLSSLAAGGRFSYNTVRFGFSDSTNQTMSVCCEPPDDDSDTCPICHDTFIDPVRTPCKHWCDLPGN